MTNFKHMTNFKQLLTEYTFASSSTVSKLLKAEEGSDKKLASACKTTNAYKKSKELQKAVAEILAAPADKRVEPGRVESERSGEPRRF